MNVPFDAIDPDFWTFDKIEQHGENIFTTPFLKPEWCDKIKQHAIARGKWDERDGYLTDTTDQTLDDLELLDDWVNILDEAIVPLMNELWGFDLFEYFVYGFVAKYGGDCQKGLTAHHDPSEVSFVLELNDHTEYSGGGTKFPELDIHIKEPVKGRLVIHPGKFGFLHGAADVTDGERYILTTFLSTYKHPQFQQSNFMPIQGEIYDGRDGRKTKRLYV